MQSVRTALSRSTRGFSVSTPVSLSHSDHSLTHLDPTRLGQTSATRAYAQQQAQTSSYVPNKNADGTLPFPPRVAWWHTLCTSATHLTRSHYRHLQRHPHPRRCKSHRSSLHAPRTEPQTRRAHRVSVPRSRRPSRRSTTPPRSPSSGKKSRSPPSSSTAYPPSPPTPSTRSRRTPSHSRVPSPPRVSPPPAHWKRCLCADERETTARAQSERATSR